MAQELKAYNVVATVDVNPEVVDRLGCTEFAGYDADEVDAVLAEKDAAIAKLKAENIRLRKRLFRMCTLLCKMGYLAFHNIQAKLTTFGDGEGVAMASLKKNQWRNAERKCRAKAEQYK